jgi:hypothetical protein
MKSILIKHIALMVIFCAIGFGIFTEKVRAVQVLGLFISGLGFGVSLATIISVYRSKQTKG